VTTYKSIRNLSACVEKRERVRMGKKKGKKKEK
jgi:hypothetical protein